MGVILEAGSHRRTVCVERMALFFLDISKQLIKLKNECEISLIFQSHALYSSLFVFKYICVCVGIIYSSEALNRRSQKTGKYYSINREGTGGILNNKLNDEYYLNTFKLKEPTV